MAELENGLEEGFESDVNDSDGDYESDVESESAGDIGSGSEEDMDEPVSLCAECTLRLCHGTLTDPQRDHFRAEGTVKSCALCNQQIGAREEEYLRRYPNLAERLIQLYHFVASCQQGAQNDPFTASIGHSTLAAAAELQTELEASASIYSKVLIAEWEA